MTPHHLAATAAAWSLQAARQRLADLARSEVHLADAGLLAAATALHSPTYGARHAIGGHADPVSGYVSAPHDPAGVVGWADLYRRSTDRLAWIAAAIQAPDPGWGPLDRIVTAIPALQPGTARVVAQHLAQEDGLVRGWIGLAAATVPLPGVPCPHCGERQLQVHCAGPEAAWVVVCASGRPCTGQGCGCGMDGAVEGAPHIWPRASVLGAVAGAVPR